MQVTIEHFDPVYVNRTGLRPSVTQACHQSLLPSLLDFWHHQVLPAFEERDRLGSGGALPPTGWVPESTVQPSSHCRWLRGFQQKSDAPRTYQNLRPIEQGHLSESRVFFSSCVGVDRMATFSYHARTSSTSSSFNTLIASGHANTEIMHDRFSIAPG